MNGKKAKEVDKFDKWIVRSIYLGCALLCLSAWYFIVHFLIKT